MKAVPEPPLVLIPAQLPLGSWVERLAVVALGGNAHQGLEAGLGARVTEIVLPGPRLPPPGPLAEQPARGAPALGAGPPAAQPDNLLAQTAPAALPPGDRLPRPRGQAAPGGLGPLDRATRPGGPLDPKVRRARGPRALLAPLHLRQKRQMPAVGTAGRDRLIGPPQRSAPSTKRTAISGLVATVTSAGTCARWRRAGSWAQLSGR